MVEFLLGDRPWRGFGTPDDVWLIDAGDFRGGPDGFRSALHASGVALVLDVGLDVEGEDPRHGIPVVRNPVGQPGGFPGGSATDQMSMLLLSQAQELTSAVAVIAEADGPVLLRSGPGGQASALVAALALLAAGASVHAVVDAFRDTMRSGAGTDGDSASGILNALWVLDKFNGVECYLLRHGLTVDHFHLLRDKHLAVNDEP